MSPKLLLEDFGLKSLTNKQLKTRKKFHKQQRRKLGFCDADLWNLSFTIARFVYPRLVRFREMPRMGFPASLASSEDWDRILDQMIPAFELLNRDDFTDEKAQIETIDRGLKLFAKWFEHLWD